MKSLMLFFVLLFFCVYPLSGQCNNRKIIVIENNFIQKKLLLFHRKVYPFSYKNKRIVNHAILPILGNSHESEEFIIALDSLHAIKASDLRCSRICWTGQKRKKILVIRFAPYDYHHVRWKISLEYSIEKEDPYCLKKCIYIKVPRGQWNLSKIDYIDLFHFSVEKAGHYWTHPQMQAGVGGVSGYYLSLGQPFYVNGMFWGCEFPATDNKIEQDIASVRYYLGKNMKQLDDDHRLTTQGIFKTWDGIAGSTESAADTDVIQKGFFSYIRKIAVPSNLRIQYNSWYDFRLDINNDNILRSFREVEKDLTKNGVPPLDSYAIDDGWNAYGPWAKENKTHFWEFNQKFPNGLRGASRYTRSVASHLGLWLGPRGGYDYNAEFARMLERYGNGKFNVYSNDIVTGDKIYLQKLQNFFLQCQRRYGINYWKLDGFMITPPQPDPENHYISGGYRGMYYVTEHWERWIRILKAMRQQNPHIWINLTSYVNPSPWFLQWGNSLWLQNSSDLGRINTGLPKDVDQMLTYRDGRYFDFIRARQFQFPIDYLYNHDPIFGKANSRLTVNSLSDKDFREYLYMMATRGNSFWELYYSTQLLNKVKWMINARVLNWLRQNHKILVHARMFGGNPETGNIYGYSSWDKGEGIVSVRNPSSIVKDYALVLEDKIGMDKAIHHLHRTTVLAENRLEDDTVPCFFSYGDTLHLRMDPGEVRIWKFSTVPDTISPSPQFAKITDNHKIRVDFDEQVRVDSNANGTLCDRSKKLISSPDIQLLADQQTVELSFHPIAPLVRDSVYLLSLSGVEDLSGNKLRKVIPVTFYPDDIVYDTQKDGMQPSRKTFGTNSDFSVVCSLKRSTGGEPMLFTISKGVYLKKLKSGKIRFCVEGLEVESHTSIQDNRTHKIIAVRERNGMLKIYIDGHIDASVYNPKIILPTIHSGIIKIDRIFVSHFQLINRALDYNECLNLKV